MSLHASGKWQKKILGDIHYFGNWSRRVNGKLERVPDDGWKEALKRYRVQAEDLHAGRTPSAAKTGDELTVREMCNELLTAMLKRLGIAGEQAEKLKALKKERAPWGPHLAGTTGRKMSPRMLMEYKSTCDRLAPKFGKMLVSNLRAADFTDLGCDLDHYGPVRRRNEIQKVKTVFKWAFDNELIVAIPRYGTEFKKPGKDEIRRLIEAAGPTLKAMICLGINAAYGNSDCGELPFSALDLDGAWVAFPRPKNGIERRAKLWPETVNALREAIARRPEPRDHLRSGAARPSPSQVAAVEFLAGDRQFNDVEARLILHGPPICISN